MTIESTAPRTAATAVGLWLTLAYVNTVDGARTLWRHLADDSGVEDSPSKLIYLAVVVAIAIAAGLFIIGVFDDAKAGVPDPVAPAP